MFEQTLARTLCVSCIAAGLALYAVFGGYFAREIVVEIALLAVLAVSLDVVAGHGGMVSLCHGAIYGLGAYGMGSLSALAGWPPSLAILAAIALAGCFGLVVGALAAGTTGVFFIMATLAFGQMAWTVVFESRALGGDDGLGGIERLDVSVPGIDLGDSLTFALAAVLAMVLAYALCAGLLKSTFGRTLTGIHANEDRMRALGLDVRRHKALAFGFSAMVAGAAGALAAQHTQYISPEYLVWTLSGEALVVVILGGLGTLAGPLVGAVVFVALKHVVGGWTDYWHLLVGLFLIAAVMAGRRGLYGQLEHVLSSRRARLAAPAHGAETRRGIAGDAVAPGMDGRTGA